MLLFKRNAAGGHTGLFFHGQLARELTAPHGLDKAAVLLLKFLRFFERMRFVGVLVEVLLCFLVQTVLNIIEQAGQTIGKLIELDGDLFAVVAADCHAYAVFNVTRANLNAERNAFHLILRALPAKAVVAGVDLRAEAGSLDGLIKLGRLFNDALLVLRDRDDDDLNRRNARGQDKTAVIAVGHNDAADDTGGETPGGLHRVLLHIVLVGKGDAELLCKTVAEEVTRTGLESLLVMHHALDGVGVDCTGELFLIGLVAADNRHSQIILAEVGIDLELMQSLLTSFCLGGVESMPLLPEKLTAAQERTGRFLPAEHGAPLVIKHGQITPRMNNVAPMIAEQRLRRRTDAQTLRKLLTAADRNPCALRGEALNMILFFLKKAFGNKHRHGDVLMPVALEHTVKNLLNVFPDRVTVGAQNEAALYSGIIDELSLGAHVGEPLRKVDLHIGYLFYSFVLCHK